MLIFAGSPGMAGAAILCGRAALKTGAGLVRFLLNEDNQSNLSILQTSVPEATCVMDSPELNLSEYQAIAAGSGLGKSRGALLTLIKIIDNYKGTLILDADALNLISESSELTEKVRNSKASIIITPHIGEAKRLLHTCEGIMGLESRMTAAARLSHDYNCTAVLKGAGTLVSAINPEGRPAYNLYQNTTGNPGMATAGSGDVLSGVIASLAAQKYSPVDSARIGVFIHGKAGDLGANELGEMGLTSSDIANYLPYALKLYYQSV